MAARWAGFEARFLPLIAEALPDPDTTEAECPVCRDGRLRTYAFRSDLGRRPLVMTYAWCARCRRYQGYTAPLRPDHRLSTDLAHLDAAERDALHRSFALFDALEALAADPPPQRPLP